MPTYANRSLCGFAQKWYLQKKKPEKNLNLDREHYDKPEIFEAL
jgi:hypothetical protein